MSIPLHLRTKPYIVPPCLVELETLYADEHIVVVNKPSGLLSVPGRLPENNDSVYTRLQQQYDHLWVVHRLDLDTSGIMVLALSKTAASSFGRQFQQRTIYKRYGAVVDGLVAEDQGEIDLPLICDWPNRPLQKVCQETGKASLTSFQVLARDKQNGTTQVALTPHTGRAHQLRVHMQAIGHSILGCDMYASDDVCLASERLLLHAWELGFVHPASRQASQEKPQAGSPAELQEGLSEELPEEMRFNVPPSFFE